MNKVYGVRDDWDGLIEAYRTLDEAEKVYESVKESKMADGVNIKESFVSIVESDDEFETEKEIKRANVAIDHKLTKEIGSPRSNGFDFDYWAEWQEHK